MKQNTKTHYRRQITFFIILLFLISLVSFFGESSSPAFARPLDAAIPSVSLSPQSVMIGETFNFTISFQNTGSDPGYGPFVDLVFPLTGQDGTDGVDYIAGSASYLGSALEEDIQVFPDDGGGSGCVSHPWLRVAPSGAYADVCGTAGDKFVSLRLPFGSYVPGQPAIDIDLQASLSQNADITPDLLIYYRGGYMFGETPLDDFCCGDPPLAAPSSSLSGTWPSAPVTPQVMTFSKAYTGPSNTEDETATGPNFPRQYTLTVTIAPGQTLTSIEVQDLLPDNLQFIGIDPATTAGYVVNSLPSTITPGGTLNLEYASGTGTITVVYDFYIPRLYDGPDLDLLVDDPVIDPVTGNDASSDNIAWADADWDPVDVLDPTLAVSSDATCPTCPPLHTLLDKSIAIQKSVGVVPGTGGGPGSDQAAPNAILEYTLTFQVSDYFSFGGIQIADTISDGQHLVLAASHVPTLQINGNSYALGSAAFNSTNYSVTCDYSTATTTPPTECTATSPGATGTTLLNFDISAEIFTRGQSGAMLGGCVNPGGGLFSPCDPANLNDGPTTGTIVFRTQILDQFVDDYPSNDISVDQGDELDNTAVISGNVLDNTTFGVVGSESDNAAAGTVIGRESLTKSIYAINDVTNTLLWEYDSLGRIRIKPGDKITYRLTYGLLTSDVEELSFDDYFPLPVFHVDDPDEDGTVGPAWTFSSAGGIPAPGVVGLLDPLNPLNGDTFYQYMSSGISGATGVLSASPGNPGATQAPVITSNAAANRINIYYANYDDTRNQSTTVDLLFSLIVADDPFADGLFLTNMAHAFEASTNAGTSSDDAIIQFVLNEPVLVSSKGVVYTNNPNAVFAPVDVGPAGVSFLAPGHPAVPPRWTGVVNSNGLDANPIDSNLSGVDAGDLVTFAISIENTGTSNNGAFDIRLQDILNPEYYQIPAGGLNLQVYYGDGSGPIPYAAVDTTCVVSPGADNDPCGEELFEEGLELIDPIGAGVCSAHDPNNGNNVILITYDLEIKPDVVPGTALNTVSLLGFAGSEGGPNHLPEPQEDDATVDVIAGLEKTLEGTEIVSATNADDEVVIGEIITYKLSAIVPEGEVPNARLIDQLDGGLAFVSCDAAVVPNPAVDAGISTDFGGGSTTDFSSVCAVTAASGVTNNGQTIVFDLGDLVNSDRVNTTEERIEITYQVVVTNVAGNQNTLPTLLDNAVDFVMNDGPGDVVIASASADDVTVIEPLLQIDKTAAPVSGDYGDTISYSVDIDYAGASETTAYDIVFSDTIPADMTYQTGTLVCSVSGGLAIPDTCSESGGVITVEWLGLAKPFESGYSATIDFDVSIDLSVTPGEVITNTGEVTWTSLPGDETAPRSTHNPLSVERTGDDTGPGGLVNDYIATEPADVTVFSPTADKIITGTNQVFTAGNDVAIGEQVSYRSSFIIPEGTSTSAMLVDTLDAGLAFVSCDNVFVTETVPGSLTTTTAFNCSSAAFSNVGTGQSNLGRRMTINLGIVQNSDTDNTTAESITVEYTVIVINGGSNDRNDLRNNSAAWTWSGGSTSDSAPDVRIVEPGFVVTKTALPTSGDYADTISYTINLNPSGASNVNAYDVILVDTIPGDMTYVPASIVCTPAGSLAVPDTCNVVGDTLTVEWLGAAKPFETTHSVTITYDVTIDLSVSPGDTLTNDVEVTWTSLPGPVPAAQSIYNPLSVERTGDAGDIGGADNDYLTVVDADVTVFSPTGSKVIDSTNQTFTSGLNVAVGEQVTYLANFIIPEGTSVTAQLVDTLDAGLAFVSCDSVSLTGNGPGFLSTTTAFNCSSASFSDYPNSDPENQGRRMTIDLGTVVNTDTNNANDESITVEYTAVVVNSSDVFRGQTLTNSASWTWDADATTESAPMLTVQEPDIQIVKTANPLIGDAGDEILYTIDLSHTGPSDIDAYEVSLLDSIPPKTSYVASSLVCTPAGGLAAPSTCAESGGTITVSWAGSAEAFETGHTAQIVFRVSLDADVNPEEVITNDADLDWSSLPGLIDTAQSTHNPLSAERTGDIAEIGGSENDYLDTDDAVVSVPVPAVDKYVEAPAEFTLGETFTYDLVVTLPDGLTPDMIVYDDIPVGLEYVSYNLITTAAAAGSRLAADFDGTLPAPTATASGGSGGDLELDFGDTGVNAEYPNNTNNNQFQVQIIVRMLNVIQNQNGDILTNRGELRYSSGTTATGTVDVEVLEPVLTVVKNVDDDTPALDQTITYTIEIAHDLDGLGEDSRVDAFDVRVTDTVPTGLKNLANLNISSPGNCATGIDTSATTASLLDVSIGLIPYQTPSPGCVVTITFDVTVNSAPDLNTPTWGDVIDNTVDISWTSLSGTVGNERTGSGGVNDYINNNSQPVTITNPELRVSKDDGVLVYVPGLTVVYDIVVENIGNGDAMGATVSDNIPSQVSSWDWVCVGATGAASGCTGVVGSTANFSDTINLPAALPAGSSITYQVTAYIPSSATGSLTNTVTAAVPAPLVEPTPGDNTASDVDGQDSHADLQITKDDGVTITSAGQTLSYTVVAQNISPSDVIDALVTDPIPAEIDSWTWVCSGVTGTASGCTPAPSSAADFSDTVNLPANSSITYTVTALVSPTASGTLTNQVTVAVPSGVTDDDPTNNTDDDIDGIAENSKILDSLVHGVTTAPDVAIGEILNYLVTLTVPGTPNPGSMPNLTLVDTLDRGLAFVGCVSITGPGLTTIGPADLDEVCDITSPYLTVSTYPGGSLDTEDLGRQVEFDFGELVNSTGVDVDLEVTYQVAVLDSLGNQSNSTPPLNNEAEWTWDSGNLSDQAVGVTILEPDLYLTKEVDYAVIVPGQVRTFTLTIGHTAASQTSAYDVEVVDTLPVELDYVPVVRTSGPGVPVVDLSGLPVIIVRWPELPNTGVPGVVEIDVQLDPSIDLLRRDQRITNDASVSWTSLPGDFYPPLAAPQSVHNPLSTERFYDPLSNINVYGVGDGVTLRVPALPDTGFAPGRDTPLPVQSSDKVYGDLDGLRIEIPDLDISIPIVSVPQSDQGWDLTWLWNQAGWLEGTAYPSWYGNTVLTGHAYLSNGLPGPFVNLEKLSWGDEIFLYANGLKYTYQVRIRNIVSAYDLKILDHKDQDWLTLFTCKDFNEVTDQYDWRQVVQAVLVHVESVP